MGSREEHKRKKRTKHRDRYNGLSRDEWKEKKRKSRRRIVMIQKIMILILVIGVIGGGSIALIWNLPTIKLNRQLDAGEACVQEGAYNEAIVAYKNALELDAASTKAYRGMTEAYLAIEDAEQAKQTLFRGWEKTQDEGLLQYYCTLILNEAVAEINADKVDWDTADKIIHVMEQNIMNEEAVDLMVTVYERLMQGLQADEMLDLAEYEQVVERLQNLYQKSGSEEVGAVLSQYAMLNLSEFCIPVAQVDTYLKILEYGNAIEQTSERNELIACLQKEKEMQEMFAGIFEEFDSGNYEAAKEFIVTEEYTKLRDDFINGTMKYWAGATYIPLNREYVILKETEGSWTFEFNNFKNNKNTKGVITVWGVDMTDNGVQRSVIAYEPPMENEVYYPHTEYVISYVYSNVQKNNVFEYEMNYHFETRTWTEEGMTTEIIGDWGGPYQWEKTY